MWDNHSEALGEKGWQGGYFRLQLFLQRSSAPTIFHGETENVPFLLRNAIAVHTHLSWFVVQKGRLNNCLRFVQRVIGITPFLGCILEKG